MFFSFLKMPDSHRTKAVLVLYPRRQQLMVKPPALYRLADVFPKPDVVCGHLKRRSWVTIQCTDMVLKVFNSFIRWLLLGYCNWDRQGDITADYEMRGPSVFFASVRPSFSPSVLLYSVNLPQFLSYKLDFFYIGLNYVSPVFIYVFVQKKNFWFFI